MKTANDSTKFNIELYHDKKGDNASDALEYVVYKRPNARESDSRLGFLYRISDLYYFYPLAPDRLGHDSICVYQTGPVFTNDYTDHLRVATLEDFERFRVMPPKGWFDQNTCS